MCPWCHIGKRRLEAALERFPQRDQVEIVWRSFQLDPSVPEGTTYPTLPALAAKYGRTENEMRDMQAHVEQAAAGEGLAYRLADTLSGNTLLAHELLHLAAEHGKQDELEERLLHAYFEEGRPVFDVEALVPVAVEVGLSETEVREALADRRYRAAVRQDVATASARGDRRPLLRRRPEVRRRGRTAGRVAPAAPRARLGRHPRSLTQPSRRDAARSAFSASASSSRTTSVADRSVRTRPTDSPA